MSDPVTGMKATVERDDQAGPRIAACLSSQLHRTFNT